LFCSIATVVFVITDRIGPGAKDSAYTMQNQQLANHGSGTDLDYG
jgi:hypothetical protein